MTDTIQITKTDEVTRVIAGIKNKYSLLDDQGIIMMALSNQYYQVQNDMDETEYLMSSAANVASLNKALAQDPATARHFDSVDDLKKALNFVE
jgi:DNA polymerase III alpha subunit (gram-positive type)